MTRTYLRSVAAGAVVVGMHALDRYESHWWYDNTAHLLAGYAVGSLMGDVFADRDAVVNHLLVLCAGWELFEFGVGERPWDGSMCWDHACEDTVLDTLMCLAGAWLACDHQGL